MLNAALRKDILRTVRGNLKRFVSIMVITALGVAMFCGLRAACNDLRTSADRLFDAQRLFDIQVLSTLGLTDDDVEELAGIEGVALAEGGFTESTTTSVAGKRATVDVKALSESGMNEPHVIEGRLPEAADEVAVSEIYLKDSGKQIGDTLAIDAADSEEDQVFDRHEYTIVGTVLDPANVSSSEGPIAFRSATGSDYTFFVPRSAVTSDTYTVAYVQVEGAESLMCFTDGYDALVGEVGDRIESIRADREDARTSSVKGDAQAELDDARAEYERERADAEQDLADGLAQIEDGQAEVDANRSTLDASQRTIDDGWAEYRSGASELASQREEAGARFAAAQEALDENRSALESGRKELEQGEKDLAAAEQELVDQVNEQLSALGTSVSTAEEARETLEGLVQPVYDLQDSVREAQGEVDRIEQEIAALDPVEDADEIAGLEQQLAQAQTELQSAQGQLDMVLGIMQSMGVSLEDVEAAVAGAGQIADGKALLAENRAELEAGEKELEEGQAELDSQRAAAYAALDDAEETLDAARAELEQGESQLDEAWALLEEAQAELDQARAEWQDGRDEADARFADAEAELASAQEDVDAIEPAQWYVQDRSSLSGFSSIQSDADSIEAIGTLFPAVFLVVAVLVSLTSVSRMVEEERGLIGTYKALGYHSREIAAKYLVFSLAACLAGSALGNFLGFVGLPAFIISIFHVMYLVPDYQLMFEPLYGLGGSAIFVVFIAGTAYASCRSEVRQVPAALMRPKAPRVGSRIFLERIPALWRRFSFLNKVTARNIFRYKKRFLMTVLGIMGCTALIVTGFAIKDSVALLSPEQYGAIDTYDFLAVTSADDFAEVRAELEETPEIGELVSVSYDSVKVKADGGEESVQLIVVPDGASLDGYVDVRAEDGSAIELPDEGVVVTVNAADVLGFSEGDVVALQTSGLDQADVKVTGVAQNYLGNYAYMTQSAYERAFGSGSMEENAVLAQAGDACADESAFAEKLAEDDRYVSVTSTEQLSGDFNESFALINAVVAVVLVMAAALAFTVLFTLSTTNISERERELATIKVLGFRPREVHHYVNKETLILTGIGILAGLPAGYFLGGALLGILKMPSINFVTYVAPASYLIAVVLTFAFALAVNLITNRTLNRIDMIGALKAVE